MALPFIPGNVFDKNVSKRPRFV